jgi:hypothetical protein
VKKLLSIIKWFLIACSILCLLFIAFIFVPPLYNTFLAKDQEVHHAELLSFSEEQILQIFKGYNLNSQLQERLFNNFYHSYSNRLHDFGKLLETTKDIFKQNSALGMTLYGMICFENDSNNAAEFSEWISEEIRILFYNRRDSFIEGLAYAHEKEFMSCIIQHIGPPENVSQQVGYNSVEEKSKILTYLKNHKLGNHPNIQKLIEAINEGVY